MRGKFILNSGSAIETRKHSLYKSFESRDLIRVNGACMRGCREAVLPPTTQSKVDFMPDHARDQSLFAFA